VDHQPPHRQPRPAVGLAEQQGGGADGVGRPMDRAPLVRGDDRCAQLHRPGTAARRRLRPVRQRTHRPQGHVEPLCADLHGGHRAPAEPVQHHRQQHDAAVDGQ
jgi:hypothetical protein